MDLSPELTTCGNKYKAAIEERIDSGVPPPNAPLTIARKGHDMTLRDSFAYRNSIEVRATPEEVEIGVFNMKVGEYVYWNEHGTDDGHVPPRPVFGPVADGPGEEFLAELEEDIADKVISEVEI